MLKKFTAFFFGSFISMIIGFITSPILTRMFSPEDYGRLSMFNLLGNILMIIVILSIDQSFVRFFYEEKENNRSSLLYKCLMLPSIMIIISTIFLVLVGENFYKYFFGYYNLTTVILLVLNTIVLSFNRFAFLVVRMQQKGKVFSMLQIVQKLSYVLIIFGLYYLNQKDYINLLNATMYSNLVVTIVAIFIERKFWNFKTAVINKCENDLNGITKYAFPLIFSLSITWLFQSFDRLAIKQWCTISDLGIYTAAFTLISILNVIQQSFTMFWVPIAFERYEKNKEDKEFFQKINGIVSFVMLFVGILLIMFKDIIVYLLGPNFRQASEIMPFLAFMPVMYTISETTVLGINFKKKSKAHIYIASVSCVFNIIGNIILVNVFGVKGAAMSTGISYIVFFAIRTYFSQKFYYVDYNLKKFYMMVSLIGIYAFYASYVSLNFYYSLIGVLLVISVCIIYRRSMLVIIDHLKFLKITK